MKKKSTRVENTLQHSYAKKGWKELGKRLLVVGLTVAMVGNTIDFSSLSVMAKTETVDTTIVSFEKLSKDITEQTLPIGASESDINFPDSLTVTVEKSVQIENDEEPPKDTETETAKTETNSEEQNETQKNEESREEDTTSSNDKDNTENSKDEESSETVQNSDASESESDKSDSSDIEGQSITSDKSDDSDNIENYDTEDTELPSVFGVSFRQMIDTLLPHKLIVHAAEKNDASSSRSVQTTESSGVVVETETKTEKICLKNIKWKLNAEESDAEEFDSSEASNGFCYAYMPVLPKTDADGNQLALGDGVELPIIYVLIGERGTALLDDAIHFIKQPMIEAGKESVIDTYTEAPKLIAEAESTENKEISYQWYVDKTIDEKTESKVELTEEGATSTEYQIPTGLSAGIYVYYCEATCGEYTATSDKVTFTVEKGVVETTINGKTESYATLEAALDAIAQAGVGAGESSGVTLKILKNINSEIFNNKEINSTFTIDLNGCEIGYKKSDSDWQTDIDKFGFSIKGGTVTLTDTSKNKTGYLHGTLQVEGGKFSLESGTCESLNVSAGTATLFDGSCKTVEVNAGAVLKVTGEVKITTLKALHEVEKRAEITLSGGQFELIAVEISDVNGEATIAGALSAETKKLAIEDMLASDYAFYNSKDELQEIERITTTVKDLTVRSSAVDEKNATVRIDVTKKNGDVDSTYYASWKQAIDYLSDESPVKSEFGNWQSVKIVLLKDATINKDVEYWGDGSLYLPDVTVCSENGTHTLTGGGYTTVLESFYHNITLKDIKIEGGFMNVSDGNLTLEEGVEVSGAPYKDAVKGQATIRFSQGELKLNNAAVIATTEGNGFYAVDLYGATLRMIGAKTKLASAYIADKTVIAVIDAFSVNNGVVPVFSGTDGKIPSKLKIFYTGRNAQFDTALKNYKGESEVWYTISLHDGATLDEDKNTNTVTSFEGKLFGLYNKNNESSPANVIYVGDNVCYYSDANGGPYRVSSSNRFFRMPASDVSIYAHKWEEDGKCSGCGKIDIEKAYENKALTIEGLEGRTYDSYPQILSKITWKPVNGDEQELTKPNYGGDHGTLGFGGDKPSNSNADYTVVYKNNVESYSLKPGDAGFDKEAAPQVTITGTGWNYIGSLTIYFTIGKGEMRLGNFDVCGGESGVITYDGQEHKAWNTYAVEFKTDESDKGQFSQLGDAQYIQTCNTSEAMAWYGQNWSDPNKVEYSTDDQKTWIVEKEFGAAGDKEKMYMITNAGDYPFYIKVTNKSCGVLISEKLTAKITPRDLTSKEITFDKSENVITYYTGKPVIPTAWDDKLMDTGLEDEEGNNYTLIRDKDFIITAENNTNKSTTGILNSNLAKATITGTGNYQGELYAEFQIKSAFTLKQTTLSTEKWYREDPYYWKNGGVPVGFSENNVNGSNLQLPSRSMWQIVCRDYKDDAAGLSGDVEFYTSLEDAIAGKNPGYTFKEEGSHTVTLWGKDPVTGYISEPVDVTLKIDTTAPTWEDENGNTEGFGIQIQENWWRKLLNTVSFGHLYNNHTLEIKIKANDKVSGMMQGEGARYYCYIQEIDDTAAGGEVAVKTKAELDGMQKGGFDVTASFIFVSSGNGNVGTVPANSNALKNDGNYIVYAYAVDNAGNKSDYICTEGIVVDTKEPTVTISTEASKIRDTEAAISVELDEDATLLYFYVDESRKNLTNAEGTGYDNLTQEISNYVKPNSEPADRPTVGPLAQKKENGKWEPPFAESGDRVTIAKISGVAVTAPAYKIEAKKGTTEIQITGLQPSERFQIWIAAIDKAGNFSGYSITPLNTTKAMPRVTTLPVVSGTYGDTTKDLEITQEGVAKYDGDIITGTWSVSAKADDTHIWEVNDTEKCQVTFTPDATKYNDTYESTVVDVTPMIAPYQIIIKVADMYKTYGEPCPGIDDLDFAIDESTPLVAGDTRDTIKQNLVIELPESAKKQDANAGNYRLGFKLNNKNYDVTKWNCYAKLTDSDTVDYCQLVIAKAAGKINTLPEFQSTQNVQYQYAGEFATFNLGVEAGHKESVLQYEITDARKANGDTITDVAEIANKLLSVSADGKVTLKGAGSAKIMISLPESTNYTAATPMTVEVNIKKADVTIPQFTSTFIYSNRDVLDYDMISRNGLNAARLGTVTYGDGSDDNRVIIGGMTIKINGTVVDKDKAMEEFFDNLPYLVNEKEIFCVIKKFETYESKTATVTIPVTTENCTINGGAGIVFNLQKVDKLTVQPKAEVKAARALIYGEALSKIGFQKVSFVDTADGSITVPGMLEWETPDAVLAVGTHQVKYIFKPKENMYYKQYEGTATVMVNKAKAKLTKAPVPDTCIYNPAEVFSEDILNDKAKEQGFVAGADGSQISGTWHFTDSAVTTKPLQVGSGSYEIYFTPEAAYEANYDCSAVRTTVTITVKKAIPYISTQPANTYTHGDYLYNQTPTGVAIHGNGMGSAGTGTGANETVAGTFTWKIPSAQIIYLGNKTFDYIFMPKDTASYETVTGSVTVTVDKAANAPFMPGSEIDVPHSCETVGSVKLPQGWKWDDVDAVKELIEDDDGYKAVPATAIYDGADKGSYVKEEVVIRITRASCEHAKTEARNAIKATCMTEGTTGEIWCLVCNKRLDNGITTPKDATNHTAPVSKEIRPATTAQEGLMSYACSDCGYYEEKTIAKLTTGGDSSGSNSNSSFESSSESGSEGSSNSSSGSSSPVIKPAPKSTLTPAPEIPAIEPVLTPAPVQTPEPSVQPSDNMKRPQTNTYAAENQTVEDEQAEPYIRGEDGKEGWDVIKAEVEACVDGNTIVVNMNGSSVVPGDVFDAIRGKDITIEFDLGNGISWHVNGKSVQEDEVGDIDFGVTFGEEAANAIPVDIVNALTGERYSLNLTLAYDGNFGFDAILRANVGAENKGLIANLFYYNQSTGALEFICADEIDEDGYTELIFTHASDYTIVLDTVSMEEQVTAVDASDTDKKIDNTDTIPAKEDTAASGTNSRTALIWLIIFAGIAIVAVGFVAVRTSRKEK